MFKWMEANGHLPATDLLGEVDYGWEGAVHRQPAPTVPSVGLLAHGPAHPVKSQISDGGVHPTGRPPQQPPFTGRGPFFIVARSTSIPEKEVPRSGAGRRRGHDKALSAFALAHRADQMTLERQYRLDQGGRLDRDRRLR